MNAGDALDKRVEAVGAPSDLRPLLGTARRVKRALPPVSPSQSFRTGLDDELQQVARRLAVRRGTAPVILLDSGAPGLDRTSLVLAAAACGLIGGLLGLAFSRRLRRR